MTGSVYQRVLGARFDRLDARLIPYFSLPPAGTVGRGEGVYQRAGSRHRWLRPALAVMAWRRVLFPELGAGVPFEVVNTPDAVGRLRGRRLFRFPGRTRVMVDRMEVVATADGLRLHDRLGRRGGLEVRMRLAVRDGGLTMRSERLWLRAGRLRVPLPPVVRVTLDERVELGGERQGTEDGGERQRVEVRITAPVLGEVFAYVGVFRYRFTATGSQQRGSVSGTTPSSR